MTAHPRPFADAVPDCAPVAEFAEALSSLASGVVLVSSRLVVRPWGTTVTSFASVSADPPTVLVSLDSEGTSASAIAAVGSFGVSILAAEQQALARYASAPGATKFLESFAEAGDDGGANPVVAGALAHLECEVVGAVPMADHTVFFGRVSAARASGGGVPLVYHRRAYRTHVAPALAHPPTGRSLRCVTC
jgi:3-hydroxy-9,10-secoandrosta-1,3,5(10)-triene-9,17-dione monooxygenase reductase component